MLTALTVRRLPATTTSRFASSSDIDRGRQLALQSANGPRDAGWSGRNVWSGNPDAQPAEAISSTGASKKLPVGTSSKSATATVTIDVTTDVTAITPASSHQNRIGTARMLGPF